MRLKIESFAAYGGGSEKDTLLTAGFTVFILFFELCDIAFWLLPLIYARVVAVTVVLLLAEWVFGALLQSARRL